MFPPRDIFRLRKRLALLFLLIATIFTTAAAPCRAEIRIAVAGPVTGPLAGLGEHMLAGAREAVADLNAGGGLNGQPVRLIVEDDQCDPRQAVSVANRIAGQGAVMVAGHFCSSASIAAAPVYEEEGVIMISPASTSQQLTEAGRKMTFRVCGRDDAQGAAAGAYMTSDLKGKRAAIVHDRSAYGEGLAASVAAGLEKAGEPPVFKEAFNAGERDFNALVAKMKQARIEQVFIGAYHAEAGLIAKQMREQGLDAAIIGGDGLVVREFSSIAGPAADGAVFTAAADPRLRPAAAEIVARFRKRGVEPDGYVLYTYAAIEAWAAAVRQAGSADPAKVEAALRDGGFSTVIGEVRFDAKGDVISPGFALFRWRGGDYAPLPEGL